MSNEARVTCSLNIVKRVDEITVLEHVTRPSAFLADVDGTKGPVPGAVTIPVGGKRIDLSELTTPGLYRIMNLDSTNYVEYGIRDPDTNRFYPWGELLPGETYVGRFSRNLQEEYTGTGTGTTSASPGNHVFLKANTAPVNVLIEAFEK